MASAHSSNCNLIDNTTNCAEAITPRTIFAEKRHGLRWPARSLAILLAGVMLPMAASAHDFWLQPNAFTVAPGGTTAMTIQVGHGAVRQKSLMTSDRVTRFDSITAAGKLDRRPELKLGDANTDTVLHFPKPGLQVLSFETNGTYSELPDIRFNDYIKFEGMTPAITARAQAHKTDQPGREVYSRRAKALIQVGAYNRSDDAVATRPTGLSLEIVPDVNPYAPGFKGSLPVHIYYYGKPLAGATVMVNNLDFDDRPVATVLSDANGKANFTIPHLGLWQLNVVWTRPITNDPKADFETTFSSLTLGFAPGAH